MHITESKSHMHALGYHPFFFQVSVHGCVRSAKRKKPGVYWMMDGWLCKVNDDMYIGVLVLISQNNTRSDEEKKGTIMQSIYKASDPRFVSTRLLYKSYNTVYQSS